MVFQGAYGRDQNDDARPHARGPALDVEELLAAKVEAEPCFGHDIFSVAERQPGLHERAAPVRDVGERSAVDERGRAFGRLHEVGHHRVS